MPAKGKKAGAAKSPNPDFERDENPYVVLDTDVASRAIKHRLSSPLAAKLTGATWCVAFVTVRELWQWAETRS